MQIRSKLQLFCFWFCIAAVSVCLTGCSKAAKKAKYLARAEQDFAAERYDRAEVAYLAALKIPPLDPTAIGRLGAIYQAQGKIPQAMAYLKKAVELQPENIELRTKLGQTLLALRDFKGAEAEVNRVLSKQPDKPEALLLLAETAITTNQALAALNKLAAVPTSGKASPEFHVAQATLMVRTGSLEAAVTALEKAVAANPKSALVHSALGNCYLLRNDLKKAEPELKQGAELAPLRSISRLRYAELKLRTGSPQEARAMVQELTEKAPDYLPAWLTLAQFAFAERRLDDCSDLLKKVLQRDPPNYDGLMLTGNLLLAKGQGTNALTQFEKVASLYGNSPQVQYRQALAQLVNQETAKALSTLSQVVSASPGFGEAVIIYSDLNLRRSNAAPAITALRQLIKLQPGLPQAYSTLATAYLVARSPEQALAVYDQMAQLFPKSPEVHLMKGAILAQSGKSKEARLAFEKAAEIEPDYLPALEQLVNLDISDKRYAAASERVKAHMTRSPKAAEPWFLLAKIHLAQAEEKAAAVLKPMAPAERQKFRFSDYPPAMPDMNNAEAALLKGIELNPDFRSAYLLLSQLYVSCNRQNEALARLNSVVARTNDVATLIQIGTIQEQLTNYVAASAAYERVLKANPSSAIALNNLSYMYSEKLGKLPEAYAMAEKARALQPYSPHVADTLGWVLYRRGEYARALTLLEESATKLPLQAEVQFHLGMTHYKLGELEPARLALERALQAQPDFAENVNARRCLALLALEPKTASAEQVKQLEKMVDDNPADLIPTIKLAAVKELKGAHSESAALLESALKANPNNPNLMLQLASIYADHLNKSDRAFQLAKAARAKDPEDPEIARLVGRLAYQAGDHKWALSVLQEAARKAEGPEVTFDLAWAYYSLGKTAEALEAMQKAAKSQGFGKAEEAKSFVTLVRCASEPASARSDAERVLKAHPDFVPALVICAAAAETAADFKSAAANYERVLKVFPLFGPAIKKLAILNASQLADEKKAYDFATRAREIYPDDPEVARTLGVLAFRRGDYSRAAQLLQQASKQYPNDGFTTYHLGAAKYHLNEKAAAKANLEKAISQSLPPDLLAEAKRLLQTIKK